ncbi:MAG: 4Fe-4S binding protein [Candidatus Lokiarchaeota archaeon]|nr:4Fe-4S binding protein [Candidatus Lokiarchaeota archaeon]
MSDELYNKAGNIIIKAGMLPFPVTDTLIELLKILYTEEELEFIIKTFKRKKSQTVDELEKSSKMGKEDIIGIIEPLTDKGAVFKSVSSSGLVIYRLLPLIFIGIFEYFLMKKIQYSEEEKIVAVLFEKLFEEIKEVVQDKYEMFIPAFSAVPPIDRTVPILKTNVGEDIKIEINQELDSPEEKILPKQDVTEIIKSFEDIAVGHCFCRQHQDLLGHSCEYDAPREVCFTLGKSARFTSEHGFARMISQEEALKLIEDSAEAGLVHKVYHPQGNVSKDETSICNCCKDCCGTFTLWKRGTMPMINWSNYLSNIDHDSCIGCGTCVERCPTDAIILNDEGKAERNPDICIGCGVCAHFCPENAISLLEGIRKVFVPPPKLKQ